MNGLLDIFSREAGQRRRAWLDDKTERGLDWLQYYAGPGVPVRPIAELAGMLNPVNDLYHMQGATRRAIEAEPGERFPHVMDAATNAATFLMPAIGGAVTTRAYNQAGGLLADDAARAANVLADTFTSTGQAGKRATRDFVKDESGVIRAYHGSPHDFDRFRMDRIGTGEGAQAYGHGLYFAENEGVARSYRDSLARPYYAMPDRQSVAGRYGDDVVEAFENVSGDPDMIRETISNLRRMVQRNLDEVGMSRIDDLDGSFNPDFVKTVQDAQRRADGLEELLQSGGLQRLNEGRMYEVNIHARPEDFLDWDAPLSAQPDVARRLGVRTRSEREITDEAYSLFDRYGSFDQMPPDVQAKVRALNEEMSLPGTVQTGEQLYQYGLGRQENVHDVLSGPSGQRSQELLDLGVPGIRYHDAGSRAAGEGTRNYVVFDENLIEIVRKYGIAGAAAMLGVSAAEVQAAMQPQQPQGLLAQ